MSEYQQQGYDPRRQPPATPPQWQGQQPQPYPHQQPPPGYQPPPQQKPRRSRKGLALLGCGGLAAVVLLIIVIAAVANSGNHTIASTGANAAGGAAAGGAATKTAVVGSAITLAGNDSGEQMSVTVTKVIATAAENDGLGLTPAGDRLYAVQYRLRDTGSAAYSDAPTNGAVVVDSAGQSYQPGDETVTGCTLFPATENIATSSSGLGCIVFEVPKNAKITQAQFTLDSGMGPQTGQWSVGR